MLCYIYEICCLTTQKRYIGSTTRNLQKRLQEHESQYKLWSEKKINYSLTSFEIIKNNNYVISMLKEFECDNVDDMYVMEAEFIKTNDCVNIIIPKRQWEEYYLDNRDKLLSRAKEYRESNREKILENNKKTYICDICNLELTVMHKKRHERNKIHQNNLKALK